METTSELSLKSVSPLFTENVLRQVVTNVYKKTPGSKPADVVNYTVKYASGKGDGYMGVVYRINISLSDETSINVIGKGMPPNMVRRKTFQCHKFFAQEVLFYNTILPVFRQFELKQRGDILQRENSLLSVPDCYYAFSDGLNDFLILEDLTEDGYGMVEKASGLNLNETQNLLKVVARYHAFSFAMKKLDAEKFKEISSQVHEFFFRADQEERVGKYWLNLAQLMYRAAKDELKDTKYLQKYETYIDENKLFKNIVGSLELLEPTVLGHGDCWATNFMFKYVKDELHAVKAIDFQMLRYCSPVIDISLFVFSCTTREQRESAGGVQGILKIYHDELSSAVAELRAPNSHLSWEQLCEHWKKVGSFGFGSAMELVPLSLVEADEVQDLDRVEGQDAVLLEDLFKFNDITDTQGKQRIVDLIKLVVDEGMI